MKYRWEILEKTVCYEGFFRLERYRLRHELFGGGLSEEIVREMLERGHAAGVLLYDPEQDSVVLVEQFRIGALGLSGGPWLLEVVAGIIEAGEDPAEVARREATEEAGCEVQDLLYMTEFVLSAGGSSETIALYCGRVRAPESGGIYGVPHEGEDIRVHVLPVDEALALLDGKRPLSAMTIIALQWLALHREALRRRWGEDFRGEEFRAKARELIRAGRFFFERGWVPATSGNFSVRLDDQRIAITVSGRHKGLLDEDGIMVVDLDGRPLSHGKRPSAETWLHVSLYRRHPAVGAVLHTHSVNATVLSMLSPGELRLRDYEVLKAFPGIDTHAWEVTVPVFPNDQDIPRLAEIVARYLDAHPETQGYLIAGHGFYTWGSSVEDACRHIEAFEFLFECDVLMRRLV